MSVIMHAHLHIEKDLCVTEINRDNGSINWIIITKPIEVDIVKINDWFVIAEDDISVFVIPRNNLLKSISNSEYWKDKFMEM